MANIYKKTMRDALKEARDYREPEEAEISERTAKKGEITITKGRKVQIIKAKNWPTYQAKGWSQSEEVEETEEGYSTSTRDAIKRAYLAGPTKTGKDVAKALKKIKKGAELYIQTKDPKTGRISNSGVVLSVKGDDVTISPTARNLPNKVKAKDISHMDVHKARTEEVEELDEGKDYRLLAQRHTMNLSKQAIVALVADLYKKLDKLNALESVEEFEGEELSEIRKLDEKWNENLSKAGLAEYRIAYKTLKKAGIDKRFIKKMEKFYDDLVIGGMYTSRGAEERGIVKIDGKTKYKNANW